MRNRRQSIMIVGNSIPMLMAGRNILGDFYTVFPISSAEKLFLVLGKVRADLILLDAEMREMSGYEVFRKLRNFPKTRDIPVIFTVSQSALTNDPKWIFPGNIDYILKPFSGPLLLERVKAVLS